MPVPKKGAAKEVILKRPTIKSFSFSIVGTSPFIFHRFSEKSKRQMLDAMMGKTKSKEEKRPPKDPEGEYEASKYLMPDGQLCFPASGFKASAIRGSKALGAIMTDQRGAFFVRGEYSDIDGQQMVEIEPVNCKVEMREDVVRVASGGTDLRYRAMLRNWRATLKIEYNTASTTPEQVLAYFESAGFGVGLGEWRPECSGEFGTFRVEADLVSDTVLHGEV